MADTVNNDDIDDLSFNLSISDSENEFEQQLSVAECTTGIQPYKFEPECSLSEDDESTSDQSHLSLAVDERNRMEELSWLVVSAL